jgi:hypothetical protein
MATRTMDVFFVTLGEEAMLADSKFNDDFK